VAHLAEPPLGALAALVLAKRTAADLVGFERDFKLLFHMGSTLDEGVGHTLSDPQKDFFLQIPELQSPTGPCSNLIHKLTYAR
jgi:hypothetical protein